MQLPKKCQYALRAVFELACRNSIEPVKVHEIAESQHIPPRFLEIILNQLRQGGLVASKRGNEGGYFLACPAERLTVGEIIQCIQGPPKPKARSAAKASGSNVIRGDYALGRLWAEVEQAIQDLYNQTSIADLVNQEVRHFEPGFLGYAI